MSNRLAEFATRARNPGETLGNLEIRRLMSLGASGSVYEAWDARIARPVAIKAVPLLDTPESPRGEALAAARQEARALGRLSHPDVCAIFEYRETPDMAYLVLEFVDGRTLEQALDQGERFGAPDAKRIMGQVLHALQHCHARGVVHGDVKPANLMLMAERRIKLVDFGLAALGCPEPGQLLPPPPPDCPAEELVAEALDPRSDSYSTGFLAPEQLMGQPADARTDIYRAGIVLYLLLTGEHPFDAGDLAATVHRVLYARPTRPSQRASAVPPGLDLVVARALAKLPQSRYPSAAEFAAALAAA